MTQVNGYPARSDLDLVTVLFTNIGEFQWRRKCEQGSISGPRDLRSLTTRVRNRTRSPSDDVISNKIKVYRPQYVVNKAFYLDWMQPNDSRRTHWTRSKFACCVAYCRLRQLASYWEAKRPVYVGALAHIYLSLYCKAKIMYGKGCRFQFTNESECQCASPPNGVIITKLVNEQVIKCLFVDNILSGPIKTSEKPPSRKSICNKVG